MAGPLGEVRYQPALTVVIKVHRGHQFINILNGNQPDRMAVAESLECQCQCDKIVPKFCQSYQYYTILQWKVNRQSVGFATVTCLRNWRVVLDPGTGRLKCGGSLQHSSFCPPGPDYMQADGHAVR